MESNIQSSVAQAIEVQRVRSGISSQAELARRAGYSPAALNKRLSGALRMDFTDVDRIARALGVGPFDLLEAAKEERSLARPA